MSLSRKEVDAPIEVVVKEEKEGGKKGGDFSLADISLMDERGRVKAERRHRRTQKRGGEGGRGREGCLWGLLVPRNRAPSG